MLLATDVSTTCAERGKTTKPGCYGVERGTVKKLIWCWIWFCKNIPDISSLTLVFYFQLTKFSASGVYWRWNRAGSPRSYGELLPRSANNAPDARLDIRARGFWAREQSAVFDIRVCHTNADSYKNLIPEQIYKLHENDKKRLYSSRVLEVERGTFTSLVLLTLEAWLNVNVTTIDLMSSQETGELM